MVSVAAPPMSQMTMGARVMPMQWSTLQPMQFAHNGLTHQQAQQLQQLQQLQLQQLQQQLQQLQQAQHHAQQNAQKAKSPAQSKRRPSFPEVVAAIESLYRDQLKPFGRILRKRIGELAQAAGQGEVDMDVKELRSLCSGCQKLRVEDDGSDWVALIAGQLDRFIDVYSSEDTYPQTLWQDAGAYFSYLGQSATELPGGRYACAQMLMHRSAPFLNGYTLGQACHIVQLAISSKKLLGYSNGKLVPYGRSQSMVKDDRAARHQSCPETASSKHPVATWDVLRKCVEELIVEVSYGGEPIALSSIKRLFQTRFNLELSETALGHAKVSELLQDSALSDLCHVQLRAHGYVLLPVEPSTEAAVAALRQPTAAAAVPDCSEEAPSALRRRAPGIAPLALDEIEALGGTAAATAGNEDAASAAVARTPAAATPSMMLFPETPSPWSPCMSMGQHLPVLLGNRRYTTPRSVLGSAPAAAKTPGGIKVDLPLHTLEEETSAIPPPPERTPKGAWDPAQEPFFLPTPTPTTLGRGGMRSMLETAANE